MRTVDPFFISYASVPNLHYYLIAFSPIWTKKVISYKGTPTQTKPFSAGCISKVELRNNDCQQVFSQIAY